VVVFEFANFGPQKVDCPEYKNDKAEPSPVHKPTPPSSDPGQKCNWSTLLGKVNALHTLSTREKKVYSQQGEDGILTALFEIVGTTDKYYVEFGVEDCSECNTKYLWKSQGFSGLLLDGGSRKSGDERVINQHRIYPENIVSLFEKYGVKKEFDLLSVDLDSSDYWVTLEIMKAGYRPRVFVGEINRNWEKHEAYTMPPRMPWQIPAQFGVSAFGLNRLLIGYGYTPIYVDKQEVNMFFIREDVLIDTLIKEVGCNTEVAISVVKEMLPTWDNIEFKAMAIHTNNFPLAQRLNHFCEIHPDGSVTECCKDVRETKAECYPPHTNPDDPKFWLDKAQNVPGDRQGPVHPF